MADAGEWETKESSARKSQEQSIATSGLPRPGSRVLSEYVKDLVNSQDIKEIIESQGSMLERFEKTNETLLRVNALSAVRFEVMSVEYKKHMTVLGEMKTDLDSVFKRIRLLRRAVEKKYPEQYKACKQEYTPPDDEG